MRGVGVGVTSLGDPVVCRDAMSEAIANQLRQFNVNLLIVPAMTGRSTTLVERACSLTAWTQALVVVANAPATWWSDEGPLTVEEWRTLEAERVQGAVQAPTEQDPGPVVVPDPSSRPQKRRGVWIFGPDGRLDQWVDAPGG